MTAPAPASGKAAERLARVRSRAARAMWIESGWPGLLPAAAALCAAAALAELALPQRLPLWLHALLVLLLAAFVCQRIWHTLRHTPALERTRVDRRIEHRSALPHRPLQTLADQPAGAAVGPALAIWRAHRMRTAAGLGRLRAGWPRLGLRAHRSGRLLALLLPLLALSAVLAGGSAVDRLASGFLPGLFELPGPAPWMQAWITPPDYARAAPVFLADPHGEATVPAGSVLQVNLTGAQGQPRLASRQLEAPSRSGAVPGFTRLSEGSWSLTWTLHGSAGLSLRANGRDLANWKIRVTPLPAALVAWDGTPGPAAADPWRTRLPWRVAHPYGLNRLSAEMRLADPTAAPNALLPPLRVAIPLTPGAREARGVALADLSADPRAGEVVIAHLLATDAAGGTATGLDARFTLPMRPFRNPLARAVLDARKRLALGRESREDTATDLETLGEAPGQFASDSGMFLNLASVVSLLREDGGDGDAVAEASGRLWELALALEDALHNDRPGARAAADVRAARDAVAAQLERMRQLGGKGQSDQEQSELERRIQALSQAIARRMQTLAEQARREHTMLPPMPDARMLNGDALARMMAQMRQDAAHGNAQEAMQRLTDMQSMLDRMRAATPQDLQNAQAQAEAQRQVREQTQALQDLVRRQSSLLDQTQARRNAVRKARRAQEPAGLDPQTAELLRRLGIPQSETGNAPDGDETARPDAPQTQTPGDAQDPQDPGTPPEQQPASEQAAEQSRSAQRGQDSRQQRGLARALDELGEEFHELSGKRPGGFDEAGAQMDKAHQALASGQDQQAQDAQQQALADLQKGSQQMRQMLSSAGGGRPMLIPGLADGDGGIAPGEGQGQEAEEDDHGGPRDPLGRPVANGQHDPDGETHVPDKIDEMRAREIEQELRRRDTDRTRPADELNYLDRLLKPF